MRKRLISSVVGNSLRCAGGITRGPSADRLCPGATGVNAGRGASGYTCRCPTGLQPIAAL